MLAAYYQQRETIIEGNDDDGNGAGPDSEGEATKEVDLAAQLPSLIAGFVFVIIGIVYYVVESRKQSRRLMSMDNAARDQSSLLV